MGTSYRIFYFALIDPNNSKGEFYDAHTALGHARGVWNTSHFTFYRAIINQNDGIGEFYNAHVALNHARGAGHAPRIEFFDSEVSRNECQDITDVPHAITDDG